MSGSWKFCLRWSLVAWTCAGLGMFLSVATAAEDTPSPEAARFFEKEVQPILTSRCYKCHSHAAKKSSGGLVVDSLAGLLTGGDSGPALVRGKPKESMLVDAVRFESDYPRMPPAGSWTRRKLPRSYVGSRWVLHGRAARRPCRRVRREVHRSRSSLVGVSTNRPAAATGGC